MQFGLFTTQTPSQVHSLHLYIRPFMRTNGKNINYNGYDTNLNTLTYDDSVIYADR